MGETHWLEETRNRALNSGNGNGSEVEEEEYEGGFEGDFPQGPYGAVKPPVTEKLVDALLETHPLTPQQQNELWIFNTPNLRHIQLTNLTGEDILRYKDITRRILVAHRWGARKLCHDLQIRLYMDLLSRKSRSDLKDGIRERPMWGGILNIGKWITDVQPKGAGAPQDKTSWGGVLFNRKNRY